jgi:hypothetical protein
VIFCKTSVPPFMLKYTYSPILAFSVHGFFRMAQYCKFHKNDFLDQSLGVSQSAVCTLLNGMTNGIYYVLCTDSMFGCKNIPHPNPWTTANFPHFWKKIELLCPHLQYRFISFHKFLDDVMFIGLKYFPDSYSNTWSQFQLDGMLYTPKTAADVSNFPLLTKLPVS